MRWMVNVLILLLLSPIAGQAETNAGSDVVGQKKLAETRQIMAERAAVRERGDVSPAAPESTSIISTAGRMFGGLALCLGVFLIGAQLYRKISRTGGGLIQPEVRVLSRTALTSKTALLTVAIRGKEYVLAVGSEQVTNIIGLADSRAVPQGSPEIELICAIDSQKAA